MEQKKVLIRVVCAWCKEVIKYVEGVEAEGMAGMDSHGICEDCLAKMMKQLNEEKESAS